MMKPIKLLSLLVAACLLSTTAPVMAALVNDVIDSSSGQAGTYFAPSPANYYSPTYFRYQDQGWGWMHTAEANPINSASLSISAWDVDSTSPFPDLNPQVDEIQLQNTSGDWITIGTLQGTTNTLAETTFNLGSSWNQEIAAGLMVRILIDTDNSYPSGGFLSPYWGISLTQSVLAIDLEMPNPIPVPAAVWLFGTALLGLVGYGRRKTRG